ncbi:MAG TPA: IS5 family transposase [Ktedonobacterales bacterium]
MILRVFRARLKPGAREAFERLCNNVSIPLMWSQPGLITLHVGRPLPDHPDEFVLVSVWKDLESVKAFAGDTWDHPLILPGEAELVQETTVQHYDEDRHLLHDSPLHPADLIKQQELQFVRGMELSDEQWARIEPLLPAGRKEGRPRANDRRTLEGILYVLRTGCRWNDLPPQYGSGVTCWRRLAQWEADGTWDRIWKTLIATLDPQAKLAWARAFLAGTIVPVRRGTRAQAGMLRKTVRVPDNTAQAL